VRSAAPSPSTEDWTGTDLIDTSVFALDGIQGTTVRVEYGDAATAADVAGAHVISQAFPHTYGQPLAHFLSRTADVPDATIITEHPVVRYTLLP